MKVVVVGAGILSTAFRPPRPPACSRRCESDVVVAAGAWAPEILKPAGIHLAVVPQRGQIVHLRLPGTNTTAWPALLPL